MDTDKSGMYRVLHEQYEKYKDLFKLKQTAAGAEMPMEVEIECKTLLENMQESVNQTLQNIKTTEAEFSRILGLKCALLYEEGRLLAHFGDDEPGLKAMAQALELSSQHQHLSELTFLVLRIYNTSSYMASRGGNYEEACTLLEQARCLYRQVQDQNTVDFFTIDDLFSEDLLIKPRVEVCVQLESLATNNLQMLGFVYNKLGNTGQYFTCSHEVLEQLLQSKERDPILWATKAGRLGYGLMGQYRFREARHHLAAALHVLKEYECDLRDKEQTEEITAKNEELQRALADVAKLWVKYCLFLLSASKKRMFSTFYPDANALIDNVWLPTKNGHVKEEAAGDEGAAVTEVLPETPDTETPPDFDAGTSNKGKKAEAKSLLSDEESSKSLEIEELKNNEEENLETNVLKVQEDYETERKEDEFTEAPHEILLLFSALKLDDIEQQVTTNLVGTTEQARSVVTFAHTWLRRSKIYYNIGQHPTEYVNAILDLSDLYRYLAFFEEDVENQYMVQKRRADALETLSTALHELRPPCHMAITIELLRELAEVQLEMVGLNLRRLYTARGIHDKGDSELSPSNLLQKAEALADLHGRLEQFGDSFAFITQPLQGYCETASDGLQCFT